MCCWDTRPQRKHLVLEALGAGWCGKFRSGAEDRAGCGLGGPARSLGGWPRFQEAFFMTASAGPMRRPRAEGPVRPTRGFGEFSRAIFTVRNFHGPPLERLGPGRRERSDRSTRQGCWRADAWHNDTARRGTTSLSTRTAPLFLWLLLPASVSEWWRAGRGLCPGCRKKGDGLPSKDDGGPPPRGKGGERGRGVRTALRPPDALAVGSMEPDRGQPSCARRPA